MLHGGGMAGSAGAAGDPSTDAVALLMGQLIQTLERPLLLPAQRRVQQGVTLDVLDAAAARRWKAGLQP